jgi:hypothetical protein
MKAAECADIARDNKAQLFPLTVLDISKITYTASAFIASPMYGSDKLERNRKEAQGWLNIVGKLTSEKSNDNNDIQFKPQIEEPMSVAGTMVDYAGNRI